MKRDKRHNAGYNARKDDITFYFTLRKDPVAKDAENELILTKNAFFWIGNPDLKRDDFKRQILSTLSRKEMGGSIYVRVRQEQAQLAHKALN
ncbi:hypothetical protein HDV00_000737 [Rhizophlyctis rosea]|nr:hypothetical protein HDV00_000737 [Rhizophlyctis rosea]